MKRAFIPALMILMLASLACEFSDLMPTPPLPTQIPSETPTVTLTPTPTQTLTPQPSSTPQLMAVDGPALLKLHMSDAKAGWGVIENAMLSTRNGGVNWATVPLPGVTVDSSVGTFFFTADIGYFVVPVPNSHLGQFFATRDGGQTWQINPVPFTTGELYFVDENVGFVFQTLSQTPDIMTNAIYQTLDRGATWSQTFIHAANQGDTNLPAPGIKTGMSFIDSNIGFIGLRSQANSIGLYRTKDSGHTWAKQELDVPAWLGAYTSTVWPPFFFRGNGIDGFIPVDFVSTDTGEQTRAFYVTHDTGDTWTMGSPVPEGTAYYFLDQQTGWAFSGNTLYATKDATLTWTELPVGFGGRERPTILQFVDANNGWVVTVDTRNRLRLYRTTDGGATWTAIIL